jgi:SAM-dependent methyltransferase
VSLLPYPSFRHMDFAQLLPAPTPIGRCAGCGHVFVPAGEERAELVRGIFADPAYLAHEEAHRVTVEGRPQPVAASRVQAELLAPGLPPQPAILDIGCWSGALLSEFAALGAPRDLCGFDVVAHPRFPSASPFRLVTGSLDRIAGLFDLVVLSHSIQYIRDLAHLFAQLRRLLAPSGRVFVQVPDLAAKPCSLLYGDVYSHFTARTLAGVFSARGFATKPVAGTPFPRDVLMLAEIAEDDRHGEAPAADELDNAIGRIAALANGLAPLPPARRVAVLGTTVEAALVESQLGARIAYFVDENPAKLAHGFHGKPVRAPGEVASGDLVIVPMGEAGRRIAERLSKRYEGTYVAV